MILAPSRRYVVGPATGWRYGARRSTKGGPAAVLAGRIRGDAPENRDWRLEHLDEYREALAWLREEASIVDTTHLGPGEAAGVVAEQAGEPPR